MISTVFNYSCIVLSEPMKSLLNRGLSFSILPLKLDLTKVLVDFKRFERSAIWREFYFGQKNEESCKPPLFKTQKRNLSKNYTTPKELKTYLSSVKSEITDPRNRNNIECNVPVEEVAALKELIRLQRERVILVKACDKGAGIIILDFNIYLKACYDHLLEKQICKGGQESNYYVKVNDYEIDKSKSIIKPVIDKALEDQIMTKKRIKSDGS